jgi:protein-disulfide isomerase
MVLSVFLVLACLSVLFYPKYWMFPALPTGGHIASGITEDGNPWIGAQHPSLTITEFTDYMCFQCGKMHSHLRRLVGAYPDRIRLVHRHFPLDGMVNPVLKDAIHENSGLLSMLAIYAQDKGKFWPVNDLLFRDAREKKKINLGSIGKESGIDISDFINRVNDRCLIDHLEADIRMGLRLGVTATPSYEINGKLYTGTIPEDVILSSLEEN